MPTEDRPTPARPRTWDSPAIVRLGLLAVAVAGMGVAFALTLIPAAKGLGTMEQRLEQKIGCRAQEDIEFPRFPERSTILASDGKTVLANIYLDQNRKIVRLDKIAHDARRAVLAIEDYRFYLHGGVDFKAIIRAAVANI